LFLQSIRLLHDPHVRARWSPFRESGSIGRLLFGTKTLAARLETWGGLPVLDEEAPATDDAALWVTPRFVPSNSGPPSAALEGLGEKALRRLILPDGRPVGWAVPAGCTVPPLDAEPGDLHDTPWVVEGDLLHSPWSLMERNPDQLTHDLNHIQGTDRSPSHPMRQLAPGAHADGFWVIGDAPVTVEGDLAIAPQVVLDATHGPIHLSRGVRLEPFTHLIGPSWIGADTRILGGRIGAVTVGPSCRVRGDVEGSVIQGWVNKAHEGFLGHAVVGSWVNLGALTTNSDLKNTYGTVRVPLGPNQDEDTGMIKAGVLLGDHVKTGIGTLISTGTVVGVGSNLFGGGPLPPRWVPPFSWVSGERPVPVRYEAFVTMAQRSMARRSQELSPQDEARLKEIWAKTHGTPGSPSP